MAVSTVGLGVIQQPTTLLVFLWGCASVPTLLKMLAGAAFLLPGGCQPGKVGKLVLIHCKKLVEAGLLK